MKGWGDDFDFDFGGAAEVEGTAPGSIAVIEYSAISGTAVGASERRRRHPWVITARDERQDAEAPSSISVIYYSGISRRAVGEGTATRSSATVRSSYISSKATGQKVFVVSGRPFGDAKATGTITEISVSASKGPAGTRLDNDLLMSDAEAVVDPVVVDNDLLMAA